MKKDQWIVGIDIGGTKIEVAAVKNNGTIIKGIRRETKTNADIGNIESDIINTVHALINAVGKKPMAIGVGMAGQIDPEDGVVIFSPNLNWHNVPLKQDLNRAFRLPVTITNDVRAATWGEWVHGAGKGYNDIICMFVGTGIGGGIVSKGKMVEGCTNTAGEIGHITVELNGPVCTCHNKGCLEAIASGWAIARDAQTAVLSDPAAGAYMLNIAGGTIKDITAKVVVRSAHDGDPLAKKIIERVSNAIISGAVSLVNVFNPCVFVLGGGIIEGMPELVNIVDKGIREYALKAATTKLKVVRSALNDYAGVIGAAVFAQLMLKKNVKKNK